MRGLVFNLLDQMARSAGCSDEAWELVVEFAASECASSDLAAADPRVECLTLRAFEVPAEAMLRCLARESEPEAGSPAWDPFELAALSELQEAEASFDHSGAPLYELLAPPSSFGGAFADNDTDALGADADEDGTALDEVYRLFGLGPLKQ